MRINKPIIFKIASIAVFVGSLLNVQNRSVFADDIDLFSNTAATTSSSPQNPNILIILDNTSNWSANLAGSGGGARTKFESEVTALKNVIGTLSEKVNVGLMMLTKVGAREGGYIRFGVRPMTAANRAALIGMINGMNVNGDKTAGAAPYGVAMFEAYKYFGGGGTTSDTTPAPLGTEFFGVETYLGHNDIDRDYVNNPSYSPRLPVPGNALATSASRNYITPLTDSCQRNYILLISNGSPPTSSDAYAGTLLGNVRGNTTAIPLSSSRSTANYADEFARFLYQTDVSPLSGQQNVVTYTMAVYKTPITGQDPDNIVLMRSAASQGHGRYFDATDQSAIENALSTIINEIQAVDTVFASVTLPVSINVRGTHLNQVYMGVFRPDRYNYLYWDGNLKQYQLAYDTESASVYLADSVGLAAENQTTGFIVDDAKSFWTSNSSYWSFAPSGSPPSASDSPDGSVVEKGGVAQLLRTRFATTQAARKVYTCSGGCLSSGSAIKDYPFNATAIDPGASANQTAFGAADAAELTTLISWLRGQDNAVDENMDGVLTDIRARVHGDVLHSRPAVVNYNRTGDDNDVMIFYGSNDGTFRAVIGGKGTYGGQEAWAFVAEEFYSKLKVLRDNNTRRSATTPKPMFMDGSIATYEHDANKDGKLVSSDGDKVYLFISMRRGGRFIYAIDVSDPSNPKYMWKKSHADTGFAELGETWSAPKVARLSAVSDPVLIFGAGYDASVDDQDPIPSGTLYTMGRGVFVVNALNGSVLWQAGPAPAGATTNKTVADMIYSIPSDVSMLDRNRDGLIDRVYVGDTGGQIWRLDVGEASPTNWTVNKLASFGYAAAASVTHRRKFLYPPDIVYTKDTLGDFDAVFIGSGDREHPFNGLGTTAYPFSDAVTNHFYMLKDRSTGLTYSGSTLLLSDLYDVTDNLAQDGTETEKATAISAIAAAKGLYLELAIGEKVVTHALTLSQTVYFNTHQPTVSSSSCRANLGTARQYRIDFADFSAIRDDTGDSAVTAEDRSTTSAGGGFMPSPVPIVVDLGGAPREAVCSGVACEKVDGKPLNARYRTYWHEDIDH